MSDIYKFDKLYRKFCNFQWWMPKTLIEKTTLTKKDHHSAIFNAPHRDGDGDFLLHHRNATYAVY